MYPQIRLQGMLSVCEARLARTGGRARRRRHWESSRKGQRHAHRHSATTRAVDTRHLGLGAGARGGANSAGERLPIVTTATTCEPEHTTSCAHAGSS
jgi:hypothetical protein